MRTLEVIGSRVSFPLSVFCLSATRCAAPRQLRPTKFHTTDQILTSTLQTTDLVMSVTTAAPRLEATMAMIALVAVPLPPLLVATGKTTSAIAPNSHKHSAPTVPHSLSQYEPQVSNAASLQRPSQGRRRWLQGRRGCRQLWLQPVCHRYPPQAERG